MPEHKYTVAEANDLLPFLAPTLVELREKYETSQKMRENIARAASTNGGSRPSESSSELMARVDELLGRLDEWGVFLRDVETGLIDFPATIEGADAYLCWKLGEAEVSHWHSPNDGFTGRRPL
jgi:hypothetical protein